MFEHNADTIFNSEQHNVTTLYKLARFRNSHSDTAEDNKLSTSGSGSPTTLLDLEDEGNKILRKINNHSINYVVSYPVTLN